MTINKLSDEVFLTLSRRREKCKDYLEKIQDYLSNDKIYDELQRKIAKLNALIGKARANNLSAEALEAQKNELEKKLDERLFELKISKDKLTVKHYCDICKDLGYIEGKPCSCFIKIYNKLLLTKLGISNQVKATFEADTLSEKVGLTPLYNKFKAYCKNFTSQSKSYIFYGKCGTGKTFLTECIANELKKSNEVLFVNAFELNDFFIKYHSCNIDEKSFYYSVLSGSDIIFIDDLGTEPIYNKVTVEYLYLLLTARKNKPLIITTNLTPREIFDRYGERIFARLFQNENTTCIEFDVENLRTKK